MIRTATIQRQTIYKKIDPEVATALNLDPTKDHPCNVVVGTKCRFCGKDYERRMYDYLFENGCCFMNKLVSNFNYWTHQ